MSVAALILCMSYLPNDDLKQLSMVCRNLYTYACIEKRHRARMLAQLAFKCIRENQNALVVAGSMALWLKQGSPTTWFPNDVDLFWYGGLKCLIDWEEQECAIEFVADQKKHIIPFLFQKRPYVRTVDTWYGKMQFVLTSLFETPQDVLKTFDLSCCKICALDMDKFLTLDSQFDERSFNWMFPSESTVIKHGKGEVDELIALNKLHKLRTLQRAKKYEQRGLVNAGPKEGPIELLTFSILYRRPSSLIYQNQLVPRHLIDARYLSYCSCVDNDWCLFCKEAHKIKHVQSFVEKKLPKDCHSTTVC